jgi:hypothetical protein
MPVHISPADLSTHRDRVWGARRRMRRLLWAGSESTAAWVQGFGACSITRWVLGCTGPGLHSLSALSREGAL